MNSVININVVNPTSPNYGFIEEGYGTVSWKSEQIDYGAVMHFTDTIDLADEGSLVLLTEIVTESLKQAHVTAKVLREKESHEPKYEPVK